MGSTATGAESKSNYSWCRDGIFRLRPASNGKPEGILTHCGKCSGTFPRDVFFNHDRSFDCRKTKSVIYRMSTRTGRRFMSRNASYRLMVFHGLDNSKDNCL
ncbi:uncharacterized protein LOC129751281 [Uranotaenia lowii]|uniref:uncharacterized protein LOC129751281 n=1 Tax=Uranotaenia lowii TaxID=190385 RepID=UPI0024785B59|nr:uncharacterized protein LOC129751281 [Uranotaenia lowii]